MTRPSWLGSFTSVTSAGTTPAMGGADAAGPAPRAPGRRQAEQGALVAATDREGRGIALAGLVAVTDRREGVLPVERVTDKAQAYGHPGPEL